MSTVSGQFSCAPSASSPAPKPTCAPARPLGQRRQRERETIHAMMRCFCQDHHGSEEALCPECQALFDYATLRLERCRFGEGKPTCAKCPVHCYQSDRREQVKVVMRYAGPRMLWKHPLLALRHWLDGFEKAPPPPGAKTSRCPGA